MHRTGRRSRVSPHHNGDGIASIMRQHPTAISMEFDMWVMATSDFLRLAELLPYEELAAEGKLVRVDNSMQHVFYLSHEWTSLRHPDHSMAQLHTFQTLLLRMLLGTVPETSPTFTDAIRLPKKTKITSAQWHELVKDSFVWVDFMSVSRSE